MKNMTIAVEGTTMTITVDLSKDIGPSKSGKTIMLATSAGNAKVATPVGEVSVGLNVYKPA